MDISKYEAASLYDFANQNYISPKTYLVIDLDDSSCGYCMCNDKNDIQLIDSWTSGKGNLWLMLIESIRKLVTSSNVLNLEEEVEKQLSSANGAFQNYFLSGKILNGEAFSISDITISCTKLDEELSDLKEKLFTLLSHVKDMVSSEKMLEVNIIILGKAQEFFLIMYYIREQLCYDPMLPFDERFKNTEFKDCHTEVIKKGKALFEEMTTLKHIYSLLAFNPESNSIDTVYIASKNDAKVRIKELEFSKPIFLLDGEKLSVKADSSVLSISLPYSISPERCDLIDVAIGLINNEDTLFIRRCRFPTRIYSVKLS